MGNQYITKSSKNDDNLKKYLQQLYYLIYYRDGIVIDDIKNLQKAFYLLDDDKDGIIKYDISRLSEPISQFENPDYDSSDTIILNFDQFIEIMVRKIINHRKRFDGKIVFESGIN